MAERIVYRAEFFKEGDLYVGLAPELNVSSFGETLDEARLSLQEAVGAFAEACQTIGTFDEVMEESGFTKRGDSWLPRQPVAAELPIAGERCRAE
jgi:predicted RNase H-like HicB family nuclease